MVTVALTYLVLYACVLNAFHAFVPFKLRKNTMRLLLGYYLFLNEQTKTLCCPILQDWKGDVNDPSFE